MGHGQVPFPPFFLKATCFPTGPLIKNLLSKYPDGKMGKMEVSGGIRKTGYFLGLLVPCWGERGCRWCYLGPRESFGTHIITQRSPIPSSHGLPQNRDLLIFQPNHDGLKTVHFLLLRAARGGET